MPLWLLVTCWMTSSPLGPGLESSIIGGHVELPWRMRHHVMLGLLPLCLHRRRTSSPMLTVTDGGPQSTHRAWHLGPAERQMREGP